MPAGKKTVWLLMGLVLCVMLVAAPLRVASGMTVCASRTVQNGGAGTENTYATGDPDDKAFTVGEDGPSNNPTAIIVAVIFFLACAALVIEWVFSAARKREKRKNERFSRE